jgi:hypothetical protein
MRCFASAVWFGTGLNLDTNNPSIWCFKDYVDLPPPILKTQMVHGWHCLGDSNFRSKLRHDKGINDSSHQLAVS